MTKRIFRSICLVALAVLLASLALIMGVLYEYFSDLQEQQLKIQTGLTAQGVSHEGMDFFTDLKTENYRITWIGSDGSVLYDSAADAASMGNHADREEFQLAQQNGYGEVVRYSATLTERLLYSAELLPDGSVIRLSSTHYTVLTLIFSMLQPTLVIIAIAVVLSLILASRLSKRVMKPLNDLNLDDPLSNEGCDELAPLLRRLDMQHREIKGQARALQRKQEEFDTVTDSMSEGLVLLNETGGIISINKAAARLLDADRDCIGRDILTLNRSLAMQELLAETLTGQRSEKVVELTAGEYQMDASPVFSGETVSGVVLLMFDVTEKESAEQMRREFTANVSHELKTPLHTISGCAELLLHNMVKPEDVKQFTGRIYSEAQRMVQLVEDIIRLSRLDEGARDMNREEADLFALAENTIRSLQSEASEKNVALSLTGDRAVINGIPQLLSGIAFNLCDNAIKYNRPGGHVDVTVEDQPDHAILTVADTGIGIPQEHQSRVFERFYRVDKSHSKEIGGTGLGLSIVKHAALLHNAEIDLESTPGKGTSITVRFPK